MVVENLPVFYSVPPAPLLILPSSAAGAVGIGGVGGRIRKWEFGIRKEGSRRETVRSDRIHAVWTRVF